jgi:hypothetical protein
LKFVNLHQLSTKFPHRYGQTGAGKSFSVLGAPSGEMRGLLPRMLDGLFSCLDDSEFLDSKDIASFTVTVSSTKKKTKKYIIKCFIQIVMR